MNNTNHLISSDNKGYAALLFEQMMNNGSLPGKVFLMKSYFVMRKPAFCKGANSLQKLVHARYSFFFSAVKIENFIRKKWIILIFLLKIVGTR